MHPEARSDRNPSPAREYYLNADFDAGLRGGASLLETPDPNYMHEMAWHFLFAPGEGDSLIVHRPLPPDFPAYLADKGLAPPRLVVHPDLSPEAEFTPFGWNAHAEALARRYARPPVHPGPDAVRIANSRAFALALEGEAAGADAEDGIGNLFATLESLEEFLLPRIRPGGWVVKGDHGHAGTANRRVPGGPLSGEDRKILAGLCRAHGRVVAEPWHERLMDMAVLFEVGEGGRLRNFRGHQLLNSRDGAFLGVRILPSRQPPEPWREALLASATGLAAALDALGYFGPVGVDAYVHATPEGPRLRPLVDINARHSMALPAHGLAARLPGKTLLWMWSKPRKLALPGDYDELDRRLGEDAFDPATRTGILATSPIVLPPDARLAKPPGASARAGGTARPKRVGFLFSADDESGLARLQAGFARRLGRS